MVDKKVDKFRDSEKLPRLLVSADDAAVMLGVSKRHVLTVAKTNRMPRCIKLGTRRMWSVRELRLWVDAGCPSRSNWEKMKTDTPCAGD